MADNKFDVNSGGARSEFEFVTKDFNPESIEDVLFKYKQDLTNALENSLDDVNRVASGNLRQSIRVDIDVKDDAFSFTLFMDDYWKFVDKGVDGTKTKHGSPYKFTKGNIDQDAVLDFMKFRGISGVAPKTIKPRKNAIPQDKLNKQLAWVIGRSIAREGTKPTNFFTDVINEDLKKKLTKDIGVALKKDVLISFGLTNK